MMRFFIMMMHQDPTRHPNDPGYRPRLCVTGGHGRVRDRRGLVRGAIMSHRASRRGLRLGEHKERVPLNGHILNNPRLWNSCLSCSQIVFKNIGSTKLVLCFSTIYHFEIPAKTNSKTAPWKSRFIFLKIDSIHIKQ